MSFDIKSVRNPGRDFEETTKRHGTVAEQLERLEEIIDEPIATTEFIRVPSDLRRFAFKVKKLVRARYKSYPPIELERFFILHFVRCLGNDTIKRNKEERRTLEKYARNMLKEVIIRYFIREKKEILERVKWRSQSAG